VTASRWTAIWTAIWRGVIAALLLIYGLAAVLFASAWGPGNSDEIVSGGVAQVPWFGLPLVGAFAAMAGLVYSRNPPRAWTACVVATACLAAWTVFLFAAND
jgi:hypothetical protein